MSSGTPAFLLPSFCPMGSSAQARGKSSASWKRMVMVVSSPALRFQCGAARLMQQAWQWHPVGRITMTAFPPSPPQNQKEPHPTPRRPPPTTHTTHFRPRPPPSPPPDPEGARLALGRRLPEDGQRHLRCRAKGGDVAIGQPVGVVLAAVLDLEVQPRAPAFAGHFAAVGFAGQVHPGAGAVLDPIAVDAERRVYVQ